MQIQILVTSHADWGYGQAAMPCRTLQVRLLPCAIEQLRHYTHPQGQCMHSITADVLDTQQRYSSDMFAERFLLLCVSAIALIEVYL